MKILKVTLKRTRVTRQDKQERVFITTLSEKLQKKASPQKSSEDREPLRVGDMREGYHYFLDTGTLVHCLKRNPNIWPNHTPVTWCQNEEADSPFVHLFDEREIFRLDKNLKEPKVGYTKPSRVVGPEYKKKLSFRSGIIYINDRMKNLPKAKEAAKKVSLWVIPSKGATDTSKSRAYSKTNILKGDNMALKAEPKTDIKVSRVTITSVVCTCFKQGIFQADKILAEVKRRTGKVTLVDSLRTMAYEYNNNYYVKKGFPKPKTPASVLTTVSKKTAAVATRKATPKATPKKAKLKVNLPA